MYGSNLKKEEDTQAHDQENKSSKYHELIKIFQRDELQPYAYNKRILFGGKNVSAQTIKQFVRTAAFDVYKNVYYVVDSHLLTSQNFHFLTVEIERYLKSSEMKNEEDNG